MPLKEKKDIDSLLPLNNDIDSAALNICQNCGIESLSRVRQLIVKLVRKLDSSMHEKSSLTLMRGQLWGHYSLIERFKNKYILLVIDQKNLPSITPDNLLARIPIIINTRRFWLHVYLLAQENIFRNYSPLVLGITKEGHDSAAAIVNIDEGKVIAYCQEERLSRVRHERRFPTYSIKECLNQTRVKEKDLGAIAVGHSLWWYNTIRKSEAPYIEAFRKLPSEYCKRDFSRRYNIADFKYKLSTALEVPEFQLPPIYFIRHHLAHAFSALAVKKSLQTNSLVIVADGRGEWDTITVWNYNNNELRNLVTCEMPNSIAYFYNAFGGLFGWHKYGFEGRLMGLAPHGCPQTLHENKIYSKLYSIVSDMITIDISSMRITVNVDKLKGGYAPKRVKELTSRGAWISPFSISSKCTRALMKIITPVSSGEMIDPNNKKYRPLCILAFAIQEHLAGLWQNIILTSLNQTNNISQIFLAGGVALNASANGKVAATLSGKKISLIIPPFPSDEGLSVGSPLALAWLAKKSSPITCVTSAQLGTHYSKHDIESQLNRYHLKKDTDWIYLPHNNIAKFISSVIASGKSIALFMGREEAGQRALGGRSLLFPAHISSSHKKANLSKLREPWRPLAVSVLKEQIPRLFKHSVGTPFMNVCIDAFPYGMQHLKTGIHPADKTCRIQIVDKDSSPLLYEVLKYLKKERIFGVVNTSFNIQEPIVHSLLEALDTYYYLRFVDLFLASNYLLFSRNYLPSLPMGQLDSRIKTAMKEYSKSNDVKVLIDALIKYDRMPYQPYLTLSGTINGQMVLIKEFYDKTFRNKFLSNIKKHSIKIQHVSCPKHPELLTHFFDGVN